MRETAYSFFQKPTSDYLLLADYRTQMCIALTRLNFVVVLGVCWWGWFWSSPEIM